MPTGANGHTLKYQKGWSLAFECVMKVFGSAALACLSRLFLPAAHRAKVTQLKPLQGKVQRPERIIVYDFAATAPELRPEVAVGGEGAVSPPATQSARGGL